MQYFNKHICIFQVYILDSADTKASAQLVRAREAGTEYYVEHCGDSFYVLTNYPDGGNYQVCTVYIKYLFFLT